VQPFQAAPLHPGRRSCNAGLIFQRRANTQANAGAARLQRDGIGQQFLQRRAERYEGETRLGPHRKIPRPAKGKVIAQQVLRRRVVRESLVRVADA